MNRKLLALACVVAFAAVACKKEEPAEAPKATIPGTSVIDVSPTPVSSDQAPTFDQKGFAGTFTAGDASLTLNADGTYLHTNGADKMDGTWTVEANDKHIRLDPNSKEAEDGLFEITSNDELSPLTADGQPDASGAVALKREGASDAAPADEAAR